MQKRYNRSSGRIDWVHFCCGGVLGAIEGARVALGSFAHWWSVVLVILGAAGLLGLACGMWGDDVWEILLYLDWL